MKRLRIVFSVVLIMTFTVRFTYAAQQTMEDGQISVDIPDGWEYTTSDHYSKKMVEVYDWQDEDEAYESLMATNRVLMGHKDFAQGSSYYLGVLEILYSFDSENQGDYHTYTDHELKELGQQNLEEEIMDLIPSSEEEDALTWSEPKIIKGKWGPFIQSDVEINKEEHTNYYSLYYTVREGVQVSFIFSSYGEGVNYAHKNDVESMVKSFDDTGYYTTFAESDELYDNDYEYYEDESWIAMLAVIFFVVIGWGIAALIKADGSRRDALKQKLQTGQQKAQEVINFNKSNEKSTAKTRNQPAKIEGQPVKVRPSNYAAGSKSADQSYLDSLKTLLDSGLVTKDEYKDLVKKHNNQK